MKDNVSDGVIRDGGTVGWNYCSLGDHLYETATCDGDPQVISSMRLPLTLAVLKTRNTTLVDGSQGLPLNVTTVFSQTIRCQDVEPGGLDRAEALVHPRGWTAPAIMLVHPAMGSACGHVRDR